MLVLSNPLKKGALTPSMMLQFADAVDELEIWSSERGRAVILTGIDGAFCSGADLGSNADLFTPRMGAAMSVVLSDATRRFSQLPIISVAAIDGAAIGGGAELATAADFRVVTPASIFQFVHASRGLIPGWGGLSRLRDIVGRKNALFIAGSAAPLDAESAARFNLVDAILDPAPPDSLISLATAFLEPMLRHVPDDAPPSEIPLRAIKIALSSESCVDEEQGQFCKLWGGPRHMQSMQQWRAKK